MQKTHGRFEWFEKESGKIFPGNSFMDVFNLMSMDMMQDGATMKTKCNIYLLKHGVEETMHGKDLVSDNDFAKQFFEFLDVNGLGSWKWYDSLIGEKWRFSYQDNDLVTRGMKAPMTAKRREALMRNLENANAVLDADPVKRREARSKGGRTTAQKRPNAMIEGLQRYYLNETEEQKRERGRKISEGKLRANAERRALKERHIDQ